MLLLPKTTIVRDREWLDAQHEHACIVSGQFGHSSETIDPAHIGALGCGIKRGDDETLPILHRFHLLGHQKGEASMWREHLPADLRALARERYRRWKEGKL
jgi:hypothetical protein